MKLPGNMLICEVGPRDGLQSFGRWIDTKDKIRMIDLLSEAGFPTIEVTSFSHPKTVPMLRDAEEVCAGITKRPGTVYRGLVPNARGAARAAGSGLDEILGLVVVSETYLKKNQNMSLDRSVDEAIEAFRIASESGMRFVVAMGASMWCPYEGQIPVEKTMALIERLAGAGIDRFYLAGSLGMEDPRHVQALFTLARDRFPNCLFGYHVHNLSGMATANIISAMDAGAAWIESAICGIGGGIAMPAKVGSSGNFASEDLVSMLELMGIETGMSAAKVKQTARKVAEILDITPRSYVGLGMTREEILQTPESVS